jgi:hypothetical protein
MLHSRLKIIQALAAEANKDTPEDEKKRDELHTVQSHEEWSTEEETQRRPGHFFSSSSGRFLVP